MTPSGRNGTLFAILTIAAVCAVESTQAQQSAFRTGVDLIAVDVHVVDSGGRPIVTLDRRQFEVTVDGQKRPVVSAEFVPMPGGVATDTARVSPPGPSASNQPLDNDPSGRTFILALDAGSFTAGDTAPVVDAVRGFVGRLQAADRVGLFVLPPFGVRVDPSRDRALVRRALDRVIGQRPSASGQFHLSMSEIIDISAEGRRLGSVVQAQPATAPGRGASTALVPVPSDALSRVQARECGRDLGCLESVVSEATALAQLFEERTTQSLNGIAALLDTLRDIPGRKTVIVISAGMAASDRPGARLDVGQEARTLGERAAHADATIYALHVEAGMPQNFSAQSRRVREAPADARERWLATQVLDEFAGASGGALVRAAVGGGDMALDRILKETSAYYLLGVDAANTSRDGRAHRLQVKVSHAGANVRSRRWVVLRRND